MQYKIDDKGIVCPCEPGKDVNYKEYFATIEEAEIVRDKLLKEKHGALRNGNNKRVGKPPK